MERRTFLKSALAGTAALAAPSIVRADAAKTITFVPHGILIDGKPSQPKVESPVKIATVSLTVEMQKPGSEAK